MLLIKVIHFHFVIVNDGILFILKFRFLLLYFLSKVSFKVFFENSQLILPLKTFLFHDLILRLESQQLGFFFSELVMKFTIHFFQIPNSICVLNQFSLM